jgi:hypothetical protein
MLYKIHVRRKESGAWQIEGAIRKGDPPERDELIEANLRGKMVKARVLAVITTPQGMEETSSESDAVVGVFATEI